jgi:cell division protein FtsI (penicillin-binding protein 3)
MDLADVLMVSSNIGVGKLSQRFRDQPFYDALKKYGFGTPTGVEIEGETRGILHPPARWSRLTPITMAFGQGVSVTAIQMTAAMAALANEGVRMHPFLVRAVLDKNGNEIERTEPKEACRVVSPQTASTVVAWMERVVQDKRGTATLADGSGYSVAGKTGTAQKPDLVRGGYSRTAVVASFVGIAPSRAPRIAALVAIDEPHRGSQFGGVIAAPVFREVCRRVLNYMSVPPDRPVEAVADKEKEKEKKEKEKKEKEKEKSKAQEETAEEETVAVDAPVEIPAGIRMPDLRGLTMRQALKLLEGTGVSIQLDLAGSGFADRQLPAAGTPLQDGVTCRVEFKATPGDGT